MYGSWFQRSCNIQVASETQEFQGARANGYLLSNAGNTEWNQLRKRSLLPSTKRQKGVAELTTALTSDMEIQSLEFA